MHHKRTVSLICALPLLLLALASCGDADTQASGGGDDGCEYNVGFSDPVSSQETDRIYGESMIPYGKERGICVTVLDAQLDVNKQLQDINQFVAEKMDAIIVFPLAQDTLTPALEKAQDQGIKTIGISAIVSDTQPDEAEMGPYDALYEQNSAIMGANLLAGYVEDNTEPGANVLGVGLGFPVPSLQYMVQNFEKDVTAPEGDSNWLATVDNKTDDVTGGQQVVGDAASRFQSEGIDAVMAYNTSSAVGAAQALRGTSSEDAIVVGQNGDKIGIDALEKGQIDAVVDLVPWRTGMMLIEITEKVLKGESVPALTFGRVELYTQDNLGDRLDWNDAVSQIESGELTCENGGCPTGDDALSPLPAS